MVLYLLVGSHLVRRLMMMVPRCEDMNITNGWMDRFVFVSGITIICILSEWLTSTLHYDSSFPCLFKSSILLFCKRTMHYFSSILSESLSQTM